MKEVNYTVLTNEQIAPDTYKMTLSGDTNAITRPGQFVNFHIQGLYLRRPISVCRREENTLTIVYKVVGKGTEALSKMTGGEVLNALSGLGNGFDTAKSGDRPVLIAGGVGTPPMVQLCKDLREQGKQVTVCLGFRSGQDVILVDELEAMGAEVRIATEDGSRGTRGFVTNILPPGTHAESRVQSNGHGRGAVLRGADGLRLRGLYGLHLQDKVWQQAHLQGRPGADKGRGDFRCLIRLLPCPA